ncbi:hypothetical protein [Teredinibacter franksiae]|uniref:hypothetical protein n=1 Tax=Teredinibacter franksiae TaxID=2761453 RepID=UPI00162A80FD|nr:hypothetical protein [Teredinibacter franksiae]
MKVSGKSLDWEIIQTDKFKQLQDYGASEVRALKVKFVELEFSFVIKINERESGHAWLGPGLFIGVNPEIGVGESDKCFYIRPKLTSVIGSEVGVPDVERIVQWLYSERFKFVESLYYNYPKGN